MVNESAQKALAMHKYRSMESLLPVVYDELRVLAASYLDTDQAKHTLPPTALVHEAFLRLSRKEGGWVDRDHFFAVAATAIRHVLVDYARRKNSDKRGGDAKRLDISFSNLDDYEASTREFRILELDDLLQELAKLDERAAKVAELRLFGGMQLAQISSALSVSRMTITTDWQFARAWLTSQVSEGASIGTASHD